MRAAAGAVAVGLVRGHSPVAATSLVISLNRATRRKVRRWYLVRRKLDRVGDSLEARSEMWPELDNFNCSESANLLAGGLLHRRHLSELLATYSVHMRTSTKRVSRLQHTSKRPFVTPQLKSMAYAFRLRVLSILWILSPFTCTKCS